MRVLTLTVILILINVTMVTPHVETILPDSKVRHAIETSFKIAESDQVDEDSLNRVLFQSGIDGNSVEHSHRRMLEHVFRSMSKSNLEQTGRAAIVLRATQQLTKLLGLPLAKLVKHGNVRALWKSISAPFCTPRVPDCKMAGKYRTIDGSCNNINFPTWGMSQRDQQRYLPPQYHDDISSPRQVGVLGTPLPSTRLISNMLHRAKHSDMVEPTDSVMLMQFGQLLDHDIIDTPTMKGVDGVDLVCCSLKKDLLKRRSACFPIMVPPGDSRFSTTCMNFVRSAAASNDNCRLGRRHQLNQATSFIDASYLYGTDSESSAMLREFKKGMMRMTHKGMFMPGDQDNCMKGMPGDYCMRSGDKRIHVVPGLASTQILFLREHNRIASILGRLNPHWNDETTYQETRKIVAAINQHITYAEYLPRSPKYMIRYGLRSKKTGFHTVYNPSVDATLNNAFGSAAFRFGHSQIPGNVDILSKSGNRKSFRAEKTFNTPSVVLFGGGQGSDGVNRWLGHDRGGKMDRFLEPAVRDFLFLDLKGKSFDLAALNIQRGRDHGVPGYNAWRKWCGLPIAVHFGIGPGGLIDIEPEAVHILAKLYGHPDDIDLFSGGLAERHIPGGRMGPTFGCIVGSQFREIKIGDRFWYENNFPGTGFTSEQLHQIKKVRLSSVMCRNMKLDHVSANVFEIPSLIRNPPIPCIKVYDIDFRFWKQSVQPNVFKMKAYDPPYVPVNTILDYLT